MRWQAIGVGVDFSACSRTALRQAAWLAERTGASLRPFHVVDTVGPGPGPWESLDAQQRAIVSGLVREAETRWTAFVADLPEVAQAGLDVEVADRRGGLRARVAARNLDVVVVGALGAGRPRVGLGSFAAAVVRDIPADALVVREPRGPAPFTTIVAGVDFSPTSRRALDAAAFLADRCGAELHVVHAGQDSAAPQLEAEVARVGREYPGLVTKSDLSCDVDGRTALVTYAEAVGADLIAVGTRGRGGMAELLLGTVAEAVLRDSRCAVWTAKPRGAA